MPLAGFVVVVAGVVVLPQATRAVDERTNEKSMSKRCLHLVTMPNELYFMEDRFPFCVCSTAAYYNCIENILRPSQRKLKFSSRLQKGMCIEARANVRGG